MKKFIAVSVASVSLLSCVSPVLAGYGTSPAEAKKCENSKPGTPSILNVRNVTRSAFAIDWSEAKDASSWTVAYGPESGKYIYGMADFGDSNSRSVDISMLPAGTYYVVVKANNGCMPGSFSTERRIRVSRGGTVLGTTRSTGWILGRTVVTTPVPEATPSVSPNPTSTPAVETFVSPEQKPNKGFWQKVWEFFFGSN